MRNSAAITPTQAINTLWVITGNLSRLFAWLVFWIAHLVLALAGMSALWWFQVSPESVAASLIGASKTTTASLLGFAGASVLGLCGLYLAAAQWVWRKTFVPWMNDRLFEGVPVDR